MQPYVALRNQKETTTMLSWWSPEIFRYISFLCFLWFCSVSVIYPLGAEKGDMGLVGGLFPPGEVVHQVRHPAAVVIVAALLPTVQPQELHLDLGDADHIPTTVAGVRVNGQVSLDEVSPGLGGEIVPVVRELGVQILQELPFQIVLHFTVGKRPLQHGLQLRGVHPQILPLRVEDYGLRPELIHLRLQGAPVHLVTDGNASQKEKVQTLLAEYGLSYQEG